MECIGIYDMPVLRTTYRKLLCRILAASKWSQKKQKNEEFISLVVSSQRKFGVEDVVAHYLPLQKWGGQMQQHLRSIPDLYFSIAAKMSKIWSDHPASMIPENPFQCGFDQAWQAAEAHQRYAEGRQIHHKPSRSAPGAGKAGRPRLLWENKIE